MYDEWNKIKDYLFIYDEWLDAIWGEIPIGYVAMLDENKQAL